MIGFLHFLAIMFVLWWIVQLMIPVLARLFPIKLPSQEARKTMGYQRPQWITDFLERERREGRWQG